MTMAKLMSGELMSTEDLIAMFNELGRRKILNAHDVEAIELAYEIREQLIEFQDIEDDPTVNPFLIEHGRHILGDAITAYVKEYVFTPDPFH
jgi:hypothetical protein